MALTPVELGHLAEGQAMRTERTSYQLAWLVASLLQPHAKKGVTLKVEDFLSHPLKYIKAPVPEYPAKAADEAFATMGMIA